MSETPAITPCLYCGRPVPTSRIKRRGGGNTQTCSVAHSVLWESQQKREYDRARYQHRSRIKKSMKAENEGNA